MNKRYRRSLDFQAKGLKALKMDLKTMTYIQSEAEFSRASSRGFWDIKRSLVTGHKPYLLPFDEVIKGLPATSTLHLGLKDIPLKNIVGSVGRSQDFTRRFMPRVRDERGKERWRTIYTLVVSGGGLPPVEVFQIGPVYFVQDGHHRVSVASYLGWPTIQAYVTALPSPLIGTTDLAGQPSGGKEATDDFTQAKRSGKAAKPSQPNVAADVSASQ